MNFFERSKDGKRVWSPRGLGLFGLGGAAITGSAGVWWQVHQAAVHAASVAVPLKMTLFTPLLVVLGGLYAAAPDWTVRVFGMPQERKKAIWLLNVPLLISGWFLYSAVKAKVAAYGYHP